MRRKFPRIVLHLQTKCLALQRGKNAALKCQNDHLKDDRNVRKAPLPLGYADEPTLRSRVQSAPLGHLVLRLNLDQIRGNATRVAGGISRKAVLASTKQHIVHVPLDLPPKLF